MAKNLWRAARAPGFAARGPGFGPPDARGPARGVWRGRHPKIKGLKIVIGVRRPTPAKKLQNPKPGPSGQWYTPDPGNPSQPYGYGQNRIQFKAKVP